VSCSRHCCPSDAREGAFLSNSDAWNLYTASPLLLTGLLLLLSPELLSLLYYWGSNGLENIHHLSRTAAYNHTSMIPRNNQRRHLLANLSHAW